MTNAVDLPTPNEPVWEPLPRPWPRVLATTGLILIAYLWMGSQASLWDRDEPRFCRATAEMIARGQYLYPTFNGQLRPDKPILIYWLMSLPMRVLGPTELACRFWSAVGAAVSCLLTFVIGRTWYDARTAWWAMVILATTLLLMVMGTFATVDAVLLAWMTGALAVFVRGRRGGLGVVHVLLMGLLLGGGMLTKGPVALLAGLVMLVAVFWGRRPTAEIETAPRRQAAAVAAALVVAVVIFLAWAIPANRATGGEFMRLGLGHHVLNRSVQPLEGHGGDWLLYFPYLLYYLPVLAVGVFPWGLFLPGGLAFCWRNRADVGRRRLLLAWLGTIFVVMTLVATKLPHYVLFMWPGLAIVMAAALAAAVRGGLDETTRRWLAAGRWVFWPAVLIGAAGFIFGPWTTSLPPLRFPAMAAGVVLLAMGQLGWRHFRRGQYELAARALVVGMVVFLVPFMLGVIPALERWKVAPPVAAAIRAETDAATPVATFKYHEPSLNFYVARPIDMLHKKDDVYGWARRPGPGVLILPADIYARLVEQNPAVAGRELARHAGLNFAKGKPVTVVAVLREGGGDAGR